VAIIIVKPKHCEAVGIGLLTITRPPMERIGSVKHENKFVEIKHSPTIKITMTENQNRLLYHRTDLNETIEKLRGGGTGTVVFLMCILLLHLFESYIVNVGVDAFLNELLIRFSNKYPPQLKPNQDIHRLFDGYKRNNQYQPSPNYNFEKAQYVAEPFCEAVKKPVLTTPTPQQLRCRIHPLD
jgi:hypothetical protein